LYRKQNFSLILRQMYMVVRVCECVVCKCCWCGWNVLWLSRV